MTRYLVRPSGAAKRTHMTKFKATRKLPDGTREDWTDEFLAINAKTLAKLPRKQRIAKPKHQLFNATKGPLAGHILDLSVDNGGAKLYT